MLTKPFFAQLHILQLEEYMPIRFLRWWLTHPFTYSTSTKKPLIMTSKARNLTRLSLILFLLLSLIYYLLNPYLLLISLLLILEPFPLLLLSILLLKPYEIYNRQSVIQKARSAIKNHPHLTLIGITGSYGKTTTKNLLFQILDTYKPTLATPGSFNTVFGFKRVLDAQLVNNLNYFLPEMGAYSRGEIAELCRMTPPDYAILTAIGPQHLERFKTLINTTLAKFELVDAVKPQNALVNLDNELISAHIKKEKYHQVKTFSFKDPQADFFVSSYQLTPKGTTFTLHHQNKNYHYTTPLFGTSNLYNLTAAISMAHILGLPSKIIQSAVADLDAAPHRLQLKPLSPTSTLIDNAYSSNPAGFTAIVNDLKQIKGKKAIITPGIVELGDNSDTIHHELGQLISNVFNTIILVGESSRTQNLQAGIKSINPKANIKFIDPKSDILATATDLAQNHSWVLIENDLPDQY